MKKLIYILLLLIFAQCGGPEARRPVKVKSGSFLKESAERNRELLALEEEMIQSIIAADSLHQYYSTDFGAWYYYEQQSAEDGMHPDTDDLVTLNYNMVNFDNDTIYTKEEIGMIQFRVDKEDFFPGLRNSVKILKAGEVVTFLFPSSLVYGYHGDGERIGTNIPVKSTISILDIEKSTDSIQN